MRFVAASDGEIELVPGAEVAVGNHAAPPPV